MIQGNPTNSRRLWYLLHVFPPLSPWCFDVEDISGRISCTFLPAYHGDDTVRTLIRTTTAAKDGGKEAFNDVKSFVTMQLGMVAPARPCVRRARGRVPSRAFIVDYAAIMDHSIMLGMSKVPVSPLSVSTYEITKGGLNQRVNLSSAQKLPTF